MVLHTGSEGLHSCQCAYGWHLTLLLALFSTTLCVFETGSCHYIGTPHWSLELRAFTPPTLATTLLAVVPNHWTWRYCWGSQQPLHLLRNHWSARQRPQSNWCYGSQWPEPTSHYVFRTWGCHVSPYFVISTIKPRVITCSSMPPSAGESLSYLSQSTKFGKGDCVFKWAECYAHRGCRDHAESGEHDSLEEHNKLPVVDPKEMEIQELSNKMFKIIFLRFSETNKRRTDKNLAESGKQ